MMATLLIEIYGTSRISHDVSKSLYIALPEKPRAATEGELHRAVL